MSQGRCPVTDFDHHSAEHNADPVASYRALRSLAPVSWTEKHGGYWVFADYASVFDASRDDERFSSARHSSGGDGLSVVIPKAPTAFHIPIELDPPEFRDYRKLLNEFTTPKAVAAMTETVERIVTAFIDEIIESGDCDLAFVAGVPAAVTVSWLGLDVTEYKRYVDAMHTIFAAPPGSAEFIKARDIDVPWVEQRVRAHIALRRREPAADVTSHLVAAEVNGRALTDDEIYSIMELLVAGGVGTTASLVTQSLVWLYQHKTERERLAANPELLDVAVEEFLRVFSPVQALARTSLKDGDFHGCPVRAGDRVLLAWASANRDPEQFPQPDEVDIERWPNRHVAFGLGVHRCAGSHLGRLMARAMIRQVLERMPDYEVDLDGLVPYPDQATNAGYASIPVKFTPGPRRAAPLW